MEELVSSLSTEPLSMTNIHVWEKGFSCDKDNIEFAARMKFGPVGPLRNKEFVLQASGDMAILMKFTLDLKLHCSLESEDFKRLLANFKEGSVVTMREGDFILRTDRVVPFVRTVLSSVRMLNELKNLETFEKLSHKNRFAVLAGVETVTYILFYNGCRTPRCHYKSLKKHIGSVFLDCPKCGQQTKEPIRSTVFDIVIENGNYKEDITLFTEDVLLLTGEKNVEDIEKLFYENKAELFSRFVGKSFVFVVRSDIYGTAEWKVTAVFKIDGRGPTWTKPSV